VKKCRAALSPKGTGGDLGAVPSTSTCVLFTTLQGQELELCQGGYERLGFPTFPLAVVWRRYRDGTESREVLPAWLAEWTVYAIPMNEPDVARARLER